MVVEESSLIIVSAIVVRKWRGVREGQQIRKGTKAISCETAKQIILCETDISLSAEGKWDLQSVSLAQKKSFMQP
jgi:hypothetical protein